MSSIYLNAIQLLINNTSRLRKYYYRLRHVCLNFLLHYNSLKNVIIMYIIFIFFRASVHHEQTCRWCGQKAYSPAVGDTHHAAYNNDTILVYNIAHRVRIERYNMPVHYTNINQLQTSLTHFRTHFICRLERTRVWRKPPWADAITFLYLPSQNRVERDFRLLFRILCRHTPPPCIDSRTFPVYEPILNNITKNVCVDKFYRIAFWFVFVLYSHTSSPAVNLCRIIAIRPVQTVVCNILDNVVW